MKSRLVALCLLAAVAMTQPLLAVDPERDRDAGDRLIGRWTTNMSLAQRLSGGKANKATTLEFTQAAIQKGAAGELKRAAEDGKVIASGNAVLAGQKGPFVLVALAGGHELILLLDKPVRLRVTVVTAADRLQDALLLSSSKASGRYQVFDRARRAVKTKTARDFSAKHFAKLKGQTFAVRTQVRGLRYTAKLVLEEVTTHAHKSDKLRPKTIRDTAFSIVLVTKDGVQLEDTIHQVFHPELGEFGLYLHRVNRPDHPKQFRYEAVFN